MRNAVPLEVIAAPFTMWVAPVGTTFPAVDETPDSTDWTLIGAAGPLNYDEAGVNVEHAQSMAFWRSLGDAGSRKVFRSSEELKMGLMLVDVTLEQYSFALNGNTVTTTPLVRPDATSSAAAKAAPDEMPASRPSSRASRFTIRWARSVLTRRSSSASVGS